jgi:chondroitin 4-sulfotransferase 11
MKIAQMLWKRLSKDEQTVFLSQLNAVDRTFYKDLLADKPFPHYFTETQSIFIHVPKCAGTSVGNALYPNAAVGHKTASWYQARFPQQYNDYFTYAFTRNPWDRVVSAWSFLKGCTGSKHDGKWADYFNTFDSFEHFVFDWLYPENITRQIHFAPQHLYICDNLGGVSLDFIGKLENINDDFRHIAKTIGINAEMQVKNRSRDDDFRSYYNDKTAEHVANVYQRDIRLFGYQFD